MINNSNSDIQSTINNLLGQNSQVADDIKKLIGSLSEDDIRKISVLMKNPDLQKMAGSIIESKKKKG